MRRAWLALLPQLRVGALVRSTVAAAVAATTALLMLPAGAFADTTIGFDDLTTGTVVTTQYAAQGLRLGSASDFSQPSPGMGDCGPPQVGSRVITAYSAPNYAQLTTCAGPPGAVPEYAAGTYGALSTAQGYVSVEVQATATTGSLMMTLDAYSSTGTLVASGTATASSGSWSLLQASQSSGTAAISYFQITSAASTNSSLGVVIDDLAFGPGSTGSGSGGGGGTGGGGTGGGGTGGGGTGGGTGGTGGTGGGGTGGTGGTGGGGTGGGGSVGATAVGQVLTPNPTAGQPITVSGAGSSPGSGQIISYDWDFNGDGVVDTSTGTNPNATLILPVGVHNIGLTITTSGGSQAKASFPVTVTPTTIQAPPKPDGGSGPCQSSVTIEDVTVLAYCIQTDPSGGYLISSAQLSLNGTILATKSNDQEIFRIQQFNHLGLDYGWQLSGAPVNIELTNTPVGTVVLGGMDLGASPIKLADHAFVPPKLPFGALKPQVHADHRIAAGGGRPLAHAADSGKVLLFEFAAGQSCDAGSKGTTCCPSGAGVSCAQLPGGFPIGGQVAVYTNTKGQVLIDVQVNVQVPDFQATGALEIETDLQTGVNLNSLQFTIPQAGLAQVFQVKDAAFTYYFPSYPDPSKADSWQAKATLTFGPLSQPEIAGELDFLKGQFHYASATITLPPPGVPVYAGVFLTEFGAGVGVNPTVVSGTIGAGFGGSDGLAIELSFKYQDSTPTALGFFGGQGTVKLGGQQIAQIAGDVYSDGYVDASVTVGIKEPQDSPIIQLTGSASFWDEPSSGEWQVTGSLNVTVWIISAEIDALVNNNWIAGCGQVSLGPFTAGGYAAYQWSTGHLDYDLTSNCKNQLKAYEETPTTQHTGGYVNGSVRGRRALTRTGSASATRVLASATSYGTIRLPSGQLAEELRITSATGTPIVRIQGPGGVDFSTPSQPDQMTGRNGHYLAVLAPVPHQVVVLLEHPAAGRWAIEPVAGSPAITNIQNSAQTGPPKITEAIRAAASGRYTLAYRIANYVAGSRVEFVERGRDSTHVIATVRAARGKISFTPQDALGRRRTLDATLINTSGTPTRTMVVGHYLAPAAIRGGRIGSIRFVRAGLGAVLRWTAAANAREYRIVVTGSDGRVISRTVAGTTRHLALAQVLPDSRFSATVTALGGPNLLPGPSRRIALGPATGTIELLACSKHRCIAQVVSGALDVTATEVHAQLSRGGHSFGVGISSDTKGTRLSLRVRHELPRGSYTLVLSVRRGGRTLTATGKVKVI